MEKSKFIKGTEFDEGLKLKFVKMEKFTPEDPQYGVKNVYGAGGVVEKENWFVKEKKLEEGESWKYYFIDGEKNREFDNNSVRFYFAVENAKLSEGDEVEIKRVKNSNTDIVWTITK